MTPSLSRRDLLRGGLALVAGAIVPGRDAWSHAGDQPAALTMSDPQRRPVKGAYLSYYGIGDRIIRGRVLEMLDQTELNAVVIDVKGDRGFIPYESELPLAREAGAMGPVRVQEFDDVLARLKAKGIYTIARIVVFKDNVLARHRRRWAITDTRTGALWLDAERLAWLDPFEEEAWAYAIAVATEAARKGFDEIQFDYLRFPTDGKLSAARYSTPNTQDNRLQAITAFLKQARASLAPIGAHLAVDLFGYIAFNLDDTGVGQRLEELAPLVDFLCPMAYPSAYHLGIPGHRNPVAHPYAVVFETIRRTRERSAQTRAQVRPWIQDFRDYAFDRRSFGVPEVRAQKTAALDAGAMGWMLWNPQKPLHGRRAGSQAGVHAVTESPAVRALVPQFAIAAVLWMTAGARPAPTNGARGSNELGAIMIVEYHRIGNPERRWTRTPAGLRRDLDLLWANGYRLISLNALIAGSIALPAGSTPVVLTFDDSSPGQFRYLERNGHPQDERCLGQPSLWHITCREQEVESRKDTGS